MFPTYIIMGKGFTLQYMTMKDDKRFKFCVQIIRRTLLMIDDVVVKFYEQIIMNLSYIF